jgi:hypothetical protein
LCVVELPARRGSASPDTSRHGPPGRQGAGQRGTVRRSTVRRGMGKELLRRARDPARLGSDRHFAVRHGHGISYNRRGRPACHGTARPERHGISSSQMGCAASVRVTYISLAATHWLAFPPESRTHVTNCLSSLNEKHRSSWLLALR